MHDLHVNMETLQQDYDMLQQDNHTLRSRCVCLWWWWWGGGVGIYIYIFICTHTNTHTHKHSQREREQTRRSTHTHTPYVHTPYTHTPSANAMASQLDSFLKGANFYITSFFFYTARTLWLRSWTPSPQQCHTRQSRQVVKLQPSDRGLGPRRR
jgi:hypothetical protein